MTYRLRIGGQQTRELEKVEEQRLRQPLQDGGSVEVLPILVSLFGLWEQAANLSILEPRKFILQRISMAEDTPFSVLGFEWRLQVPQPAG